MAVDFRGHPMFPSTGFNTPSRFEADVYDCEVWGKIPIVIEGNLYRMQCDFQYRPPQNEWHAQPAVACRVLRLISRPTAH